MVYSSLTCSFVPINFSDFSKNADFHFYFSVNLIIFGTNKWTSFCKQGSYIENNYQHTSWSIFYPFLRFPKRKNDLKKMIGGFQLWTFWSFMWTDIFLVGLSKILMLLFLQHRIVLYLKCGVRFKPIMHNCVQFLKINGCGVPTLNMLIIFVN